MFGKKFDELFGNTEPEKVPEQLEPVQASSNDVEAAALPEDEFEPVRPLDSESDPKENDPFTSMITQMLEGEGVDVELEMRRKYNPSTGNVQTHDWVSQRERLFSGEPYQFRCKRCLKWVEVGPEEVLGEVLTRNEIDPNCSQQVITDIMTS